MEKFILTINLELILHMHNISCGVKRIPPNVQTNISNVGIPRLTSIDRKTVEMEKQ